MSDSHPVTLNFHPDTLHGLELTIQTLAREHLYRSQFETGLSNGGLTAHPGGDRWNWESRMFGGAYDGASPEMRPKYGALNYRHWTVGGSPRFGSTHIRLRRHMLTRTTFCYPDSHLAPRDFGVSSRMSLIELADRNPTNLDILDDYIEAHIHGPIHIGEDVEAIVLDPSYAGTDIEEAASNLPCPIEWHEGFCLSQAALEQCELYRGQRVAELLARLAVDGQVTPRQLGQVRGTDLDRQDLKQAWHCLAKFGNPLMARRADSPTGRAP